MPNWSRRSVLSTGVALSTAGALASMGATTEEGEETEAASSRTVSTGDPAGWSSTWGNAANSNYLPIEGAFPEPDTVAWRHDLPNFRTWHDGTVAVVDGRIYLLTGHETTDERIGGVHRSYRTELRALDAETGDVDWQLEVEGKYRPTVADGLVTVSARDRVTAFNAETGSVRWERPFDTVEWPTSPTPADGTLYVVAGETLYALDGEDGSVRWRRERVEVGPANDDASASASVSTSFAPRPVAVVDGTAYAITEPCNADSSDPVAGEGGVAALDAATGESEWAVVPEGGVSSDLVATEEFVFARRELDVNRGPLLDPDTGEVVRRETVNVVAATPDTRVTHDTTYPGSGGVSIHPYDDGETWTVSDVAFQAPLVGGETLIAFHEGTVAGFDLETGAKTWRWEGDVRPRALVAVDEDTLYVGHEGQLLALRPSDDGEGEGEDESESDADREDPDERRRDDSDDGGADGPESDCPRAGTDAGR